MSRKTKRGNRPAGEKESAEKPTSPNSRGRGHKSGNKSGVDRATINPQQFESGREVAAAIAKQYDLAIIGGRLLSGASEVKGASVCLRMFETTMEYLFGKPSSHPHTEPASRPRFVWDISLPAPEPIDEGDLP